MCGQISGRNCVKVEVAVLGSQSPIVITVSVGVKQHLKKLRSRGRVEVDVLGSPSLKVRYNYVLCGRKAALNLKL